MRFSALTHRIQTHRQARQFVGRFAPAPHRRSWPSLDRSRAQQRNASRDALRHLPEAERGASLVAFPRRSVGTITAS